MLATSRRREQSRTSYENKDTVNAVQYWVGNLVVATSTVCSGLLLAFFIVAYRPRAHALPSRSLSTLQADRHLLAREGLPSDICQLDIRIEVG